LRSPPSERGGRSSSSTTKPWSAFSPLSRRRARQRHSNQRRLPRDESIRALQIACCHEGYPGHHTRNTLRDPRRAAVIGRERSVQLTFLAPKSLASEASAMLAADIAFSSEERLQGRGAIRLFSAREPAARRRGVAYRSRAARRRAPAGGRRGRGRERYLDGQLEFTRAVAELEERGALVPHAEGCRSSTSTSFRSYVTTYTAGAPPVFAARLRMCEGTAPTNELRWRCFQQESTR